MQATTPSFMAVGKEASILILTTPRSGGHHIRSEGGRRRTVFLADREQGRVQAAPNLLQGHMVAIIRSGMGKSIIYNLIRVRVFLAEDKIVFGIPDVPQNICNLRRNL